MDIYTFNIINIAWIAIAVGTFLTLVFTKIRAPYGRHANEKWGKMISNKWGWVIMELPALLTCPLLAIFGPREKGVLSWILIGMWLLHYFNRTVIFPFRLRTKGKKMPLTIVFSAIFFNGVNGFLNGYFIGFIAPPDDNWATITVFIGITIYLAGFVINNVTDTKLIRLRKKNTEYQIPRGWLFRYISCPNHFGEMIEWVGFAIVGMSLPAWTFAIWTVCNLIPRTLNHHAWYKEKFPDYPKNRKAFLPRVW